MRNKIKITYNAPVTLTFIITCFIVLVLGAITSGWTTQHLFSVYASSFLNPVAYVRLFTHVLGHSGLEHFTGNAMCILLLGPMLEEKYGSVTILKVVVVTAAATGLAHCLLSPLTIMCGASGVVFAMIVLSSFTAFKEGEIPLSFVLVIAVFLGGEVFSGITLSDNVANGAHVIGGLVGGVAGYALNARSASSSGL